MSGIYFGGVMSNVPIATFMLVDVYVGAKQQNARR